MDTRLILLLALLTFSSGCLCGIIPESKPTVNTTTTITTTTLQAVNETTTTIKTTTITPASNETTETTTTTDITTTTISGGKLTTTQWLALMPEDFKHQALNLRWQNPTSACAQYGANAARTDWLTFLGLKAKYNDGVVYETGGMILEPGRYNLSQDSYCFLKQTGSTYGMHGQYHGIGFFLNNSQWDATHTNKTWIIENSTDENHTDYYIATNYTDDLWVVPR